MLRSRGKSEYNARLKMLGEFVLICRLYEGD
jgi:hypothetical protein